MPKFSLNVFNIAQSGTMVVCHSRFQYDPITKSVWGAFSGERPLLLGRQSDDRSRCLLRVIAKLGGNENRAKTTLFNWGQGSEWIDPSAEQCKYFGFDEGTLLSSY